MPAVPVKPAGTTRVKPAMTSRHAPEGAHPLARIHTPVRRVSGTTKMPRGQHPGARK